MQVTDEMVDAFGKAWLATPEGEPGDRRRAGIAAVLALVDVEGAQMLARDQVLVRVLDPYIATDAYCDLVDSGLACTPPWDL